MRLIIPLLTLLIAPAFGAELFRDDFSKLPPGWLSAPMGRPNLNGAIQEYHYLPHRGVPTGAWSNPIVHQDAWLVSDEDGKSYIEHHPICDRCDQYNALFITGDPEWSDYAVEVRVKPLAKDQFAGVVFRYHTNKHHYQFALRQGREAVIRLQMPVEEKFRIANWRDLAVAPFAYDATRYYALKVETEGSRIRAYVDGKLIVEATDGELKKGRAGIAANVPSRFMDFRVTASDTEARALQGRIASREAELTKLRAANPKPKLWKKFATPVFGAGRNVRFGDLDGDGQIDMLFAQNITRVRGDAFDHISSLTAVTLDGKVLWQKGRPDARNGLLTNDTPFQIHDVDGDGKSDVVLVRDFHLQILEGRTGEVKKSARLPEMTADLREKPYQFHNGDSIFFVNFSGNPGRREILVKDRYRNFWVFDNNLKQIFHGEGQTGHYPYPADLDGDGKDEFMIGYSLWNAAGKRLWSHDTALHDHADALILGNFSGDAKADPRAYVCGSDEGFMVIDRAGKILRQQRVGHTQSLSIAKYRPELSGLQFMTVNFWRNPGIVSLFDHDGNLLQQEEPIHSGSLVVPVNWTGDGREFAMLSGNPVEGGLIDGQLRRVVMFPNDGHPDLAYAVHNLTGDARDEIVLWDTEHVWIYTQDRPFTGKRIYAPVRNPNYNDSNYRTTASQPAWKE